MNRKSENLSKGIVLFAGYGIENYPGEYSDRVGAAFGRDAHNILNQVQQVFSELNQLKPEWSKYSLPEAGKWAKNQMKIRYPDLNDDALNALEWTFTWWWK